MLAGKFNHSIDEKGRIRIPVRLKEELGDRLFITKGLKRRLLVFSEEVAEQMFSEKLKDDKFATSEFSDMRLKLLSSGVIVEHDSQGRTQLPAELIAYARISKNIVTIGNLDRVEIWSEENWNENQASDDDDFDECLRKAAEFFR